MPGARTPVQTLAPLSYHMAYTLISTVNNAGGSLRQRLNLVDEIYGDICARMEIKRKDLKELKNADNRAAVDEGLQAINEAIQFLRRHYEPALDLNIFTYGKAGAYESAISEILRTEKVFIERWGLLTKDDFQALSWSSPGGMGVMP